MSMYMSDGDPEPIDVEEAGLRPASPADLLAAVRRGVESGTIEGEVVEHCVVHYSLREPMTPVCQDAYRSGVDGRCDLETRLVIPVSDGGSET